MNKELTPLQAFDTIKSEFLYQLKERTGDNGELFETELTIIETALKENEQLKKCYKNELKNVSYYNNLALKYYKALEIIKNKEVNIALIKRHWDLEDYNLKEIPLAKEEYEFLKEILK